MKKLISIFKKNRKSSSDLVDSRKVEINDFIYNNNLVFYTMLKLLIKCKLSDKQLIITQLL